MTVSKQLAYSTLVIILCAAAHDEAAANDDPTTDSGAWLQLVAEGNLTYLSPKLDKVRLWTEGQGRFNDDFQRFYQGLMRIALGYSVTEHATIWAGYTWLPTHAKDKPFLSQQDVWPGFRYILPTDFGTFMFRTMIESNFGKGDEVRVRPRQMFRFMHPFGFEPHLSLITWDEVFVRVNTTHWGGDAGFDQNRGFVGFGWTFNPNFRTELGYMNQYIDNYNHEAHTIQNLVMASLFINY